MFETGPSNNPMAVLQSERLRYPDFDTFIKNTMLRYRRSPWVEYIHEVSIVVEPTDRVLGEDKDYPAASAFFQGAVLGLLVTQECASKEIRLKMLELQVGEDNEDEDTLHRFHNLADSIIDLGEQGCAKFPELTELIESWEDEIVPDVRYQPFVRRGFGMMMHLMHTANEQVMTEELERAVRDGVDWDADFSQLFPADDA